MLGLAVAEPHVIPNEIFEEDAARDRLRDLDAAGAGTSCGSCPKHDLPDWYIAQIKHLARVEFRATWLGVYLATKEPIHALDPRELATWLHTPNLPHAGFFFNMTAMDPSVAPEGSYLYVGGLDIPGEKVRDVKWMLRGPGAVREGPGDHVPGPRPGVLAPAPPRPRARSRRDPEAEPRRAVPTALARPERRGPVLRLGHVPLARRRRRPGGSRRPDRASRTILGRRLATFGDGWRY